MTAEISSSAAGRVVVTGVGVVSPFGSRTPDLLEGIWSGREAFVPVRQRREPWQRAARAAVVQDFQPRRFIPPMLLRRLDPSSSCFLAAAALALADAGLVVAAEGGAGEVFGEALQAAGVVVGTGTAGSTPVIDYLQGLMGGSGEGSFPLLFPNTVPNAPGGQAAIRYRIRGPNATLSQRESSGLAALARAACLLRAGRCRVALAGGVDEFSGPMFDIFDRLRFLSPGTSGREEACRPFDRRRNGWMLGAGAYLLVLETEEHARGRGAAARGVVLGAGENGRSVPLCYWPKEAEPYIRCMRLALQAGGLEAGGVGAVFASANGNPVLDRSEGRALEALFGAGTPVTAIKSVIGECGAAGAAQAIAALESFRRLTLPPTRGYGEPDAGVGIDVVAGEPRPMAGRPRPALINSFASGGANVSLVLAPPGGEDGAG